MSHVYPFLHSKTTKKNLDGGYLVHVWDCNTGIHTACLNPSFPIHCTHGEDCLASLNFSEDNHLSTVCGEGSMGRLGNALSFVHHTEGLILNAYVNVLLFCH